MAKIPKVYQNSIRFELDKSNPPKLRVKADGYFPTWNWSDPLLSPLFNENEIEQIEIFQFDFVGTPPTTPDITIIREITGEYTFPQLPKNLKKIIINAENNSAEYEFSFNYANNLNFNGNNNLSALHFFLYAQKSIGEGRNFDEALASAIRNFPLSGIMDDKPKCTVSNIEVEWGGFAGLPPKIAVTIERIGNK